MTIRQEMEFGRIMHFTFRYATPFLVILGAIPAAFAQQATQPGGLPPASTGAPETHAQPDRPQPAEPTSAPSRALASAEQGYVRVTARAVNIRSRADINSTPVALMSRDSILRVTGKESGWFKVEAPAGVFYYVSARYVERTGDNAGRVHVSTTPLNVRVGSLVTTVDPEKADVVGQVSNGTPLEILGQEGDWLRVRPPAGLYCYLSEDFAQQVSDTEGVAGINMQPAVAAQTPAGDPAPTAIRHATSAPALTGEHLTGDWGKQYAALDQDIQSEAMKPILSQSWDKLLDRARRIADQREEPQVAAAADAWIPRMERQRSEQGTQRKRAAVASREAADSAQLDSELNRIAAAREEFEGRTDFDAIGLLRPTFALPTGEYGLRYKLIDPTNQQTRAYIEIPTDLGLEINKINGKYVAIFGERLTNAEFKDIGAPMYRVQKLSVLTSASSKPASVRERP